MTKVAIVILNWNGAHYLRKFLPLVLKYSIVPGYQVIVVDNASSDDSIELMQAEFSTTRLIEFDKNHGFAGGYKKAFEIIEAEYYVLLNSDIEVSKNWLQPAIEFLDSHPEAAAAMPKIKAYHKKTHFEYAGACGGYIDKLGYPFCRGRILSEIEEDYGVYENIQEIFWATGASLIVRAEVYKKAGGLDERFFAHMEEIDLCWRIKNLGYKIFVIPACTVYHVGGGTLPNNTPTKLYLNYRNSLFMLYKNLPTSKKPLIMLIRLLLDGISALVYLAKGQFSFFGAVIRAHASFYRQLGELRAERKHLPQSNTLSAVYQKSILAEFFIRKNRKFSTLDKQALNIA